MSQPWVCPKCDRVWAPYISHCQPCNSQVEARSKSRRDQLIESIKETAGRVGAEFIPDAGR